MTSKQSETWRVQQDDGTFLGKNHPGFLVLTNSGEFVAFCVTYMAADELVRDHAAAQREAEPHATAVVLDAAEQKVWQLEERLAAGEQAIEELRAALAAYRATHQPATEVQG